MAAAALAPLSDSRGDEAAFLDFGRAVNDAWAGFPGQRGEGVERPLPGISCDGCSTRPWCLQHRACLVVSIGKKKAAQGGQKVNPLKHPNCKTEGAPCLSAIVPKSFAGPMP
jgi:hypothetical protein